MDYNTMTFTDHLVFMCVLNHFVTLINKLIHDVMDYGALHHRSTAPCSVTYDTERKIRIPDLLRFFGEMKKICPVGFPQPSDKKDQNHG